MAERLLSPDEQSRLFAEFGGVDKNKMGGGEGERLLQLAEGLTAGVHTSRAGLVQEQDRVVKHARGRNRRHKRIRTRPFQFMHPSRR